MKYGVRSFVVGGSVYLFFRPLLTLVVMAFALFPIGVHATVQNVESYGAKGDNGVTDDTGPINTAISNLQPGDTLLFPCTTGNIYVIKSQLTIFQNKNQVLLSGVTIDGSGCAVIKDQYSGQFQGEVMVIGGNGNGAPNLGSAVSLSATANELATSFTTSLSLGAVPGDYVYLCQGGVGGSASPGMSCPGSTNGICDPSSCRGEVLKVAGVSGNTVSVTTALHDTYDPVANLAFAYKILSPLTGITVQNITFDGTASNVYGLVLAGVAESTVSGVTSKNLQGAAIWSTGAFNVSYSNINVTAAGSEQCGGAVFLQSQGNVSVNGMSMSALNPGSPDTGCLGHGAFGLEYMGSANGTISNLDIDATGSAGRPLKTTAARWNTFNSPVVEKGNLNYSTFDNGISMEYYSSHNTFNSCIVTNNGQAGTETGNAGINLFGNYNQYNDFNNCIVSGNGNVQFLDQYGSDTGHQTDSHNTVNGGSYTGSNAGQPVMLIQADSSSTFGATFAGPGGSPGSSNPWGIYLDTHASNGCVNNNTFTAGSGLYGAVSANGVNDLGSGNQFNNLNVGGNGSLGTCGNNVGHAVQGANAGTTMSNTITASRHQMAGQSGTITSMSVFVASPVSASPNNQFQLAIYSDNSGTPGSLIASSPSQTIAADAWTTVLIDAPITANAYYWLAYNSNGLTGNANNVLYDSEGTMSWITPESFGTWPSTFGTPSGSSTADLSIYATVQFGSLGHEVQGANVGTTMSNTITASRYQMASQSGTITSMSVFIASPVSASPNNQFQVAIYADNSGTPGALIASSASQTIVPDAWNTVVINTPIAANAYYWLAYNTNGLNGSANNVRYDSEGTMSWITPESFGTWPGTFGTPSGSSAGDLSIYATFQ